MSCSPLLRYCAMTMDQQTIYVRPPVWALLLAVVIGGGFYITGKHLETRNQDPATIQVSGEGKVTASPDIAELTFGFDTGNQKTSDAAMQMLKKSMDSALA